MARLLPYHQERTTITENQFILKVVQVKASLVWPPVSNGYIPFSLSLKGNLKKKALFAEIWAMVTNDFFAPGSRPKFLLKSLSDDEGDEGARGPASDQPQVSQPVSSQSTLQNGDFMGHHQGGVSQCLVSVD